MNRPPYQPRAGIIQPIEGNRWLVTIAGVMHDYPPTDEEGFLKFARSLSSPELYRAIEHAQAAVADLGLPPHREPAAPLRQAARMPQGFVALGDSVCAFNPVYGVGMTLTCLEALALRKCLREGKGRLDSQRFQKRLAKLVAGPWALTTGEDLRWPATQGGTVTAKVKFMHWYIEQVIRLIPQSQEIFRRFQEVNHMLKAPAALFHPAVLGPVLRQAFGAAAQGAEAADGAGSGARHLAADGHVHVDDRDPPLTQASTGGASRHPPVRSTSKPSGSAPSCPSSASRGPPCGCTSCARPRRARPSRCPAAPSATPCGRG